GPVRDHKRESRPRPRSASAAAASSPAAASFAHAHRHRRGTHSLGAGGAAYHRFDAFGPDASGPDAGPAAAALRGDARHHAGPGVRLIVERAVAWRVIACDRL